MLSPTMTTIINRLKRNIWVVGLATTSSLLVIISNFSGVGWSWDSTDYVAVGLNFAEGRGLLDVIGKPMTVRPPGLSALIAVGVWLGIGSGLFLQLLNAACAAVVVICTYLLLQRAVTNRQIMIVATAFVALSPALLWQYSMAWSEPPFLALLLIAMIVSMQRMTLIKIVLLTLLMSSLFFIRYVGPVFSVSIMIGSIMANRKQLGILKSALANTMCLALSFIPVWSWLLRNRRIDGTLTGARAPGGGSLIDPLKTFTGTLGTWVLGRPFEGGIYLSWNNYPTNARVAGLLFLIITASLLLVVTARKHLRPTPPVGTAHVLILSLVISVLYVGFSAYRFVHWELGPLDHRMMIPIYVPIIIVISIAIDQILPQREKMRGIIVGFVVVLLGLHISSTLTDALKFGREGRHWTAKGFQNLPLHQFVRDLPAQTLLLSNEPQQLFAISRRWPVFNQYQLDAAQSTPCDHRYFVWYTSTFNDGTPNLDGQPERSETVYSDSLGTVFDLGECSTEVNYYWP